MDDYCPRERRVTNHAVVAMVGDEVKQTRCTTCDAEHEYKHARVPPQRKKKDVSGALYQQVLDGIPRVVPTPDQALDDEPDAEVVAQADVGAEGEPLAAENAPASEHEGPVHRRLIRATLPRLPGAEAPARREPEFTMRSPAHGRPGKPKNGFRGGGGGGMHRAGGPQGHGPDGANGNRAGRRHGRPGGESGWNRSGQGQAGPGGRGPGGQRPGRGGKKRSR